MATESLEDIVEKLNNLKVVELAKLKKLLEDAWGVTAQAPMAMMAAPQGGAAPAAAAAEATDFQVVLNEVPADKKIGVIKVIRDITGLGLKEAMDLAAAVPKPLKDRAPKAEAEEIVKKVEAAGGKASLKAV